MFNLYKWSVNLNNPNDLRKVESGYIYAVAENEEEARKGVIKEYSKSAYINEIIIGIERRPYKIEDFPYVFSLHKYLL